MNMVRTKQVLLALAVLLVLIQLVQPSRTNPPVVEARSLDARSHVPPEVQAILKRACYNCHSNSTVWPWYSHVAPVSWLVVDDVNSGRRHINFQAWGANETPQEAAGHISLVCENVRQGDMPPLDYRIMHPDSRLSAMDVKTVCSWSQSFSLPPTPTGNP